MRPYSERKREMENAIRKYTNTPTNRRLKYCAYGMISLCAILSLVALLFFDYLELKSILILRASAGLCAVIFMVLYGILIYRVHRAYWLDKYKFSFIGPIIFISLSMLQSGCARTITTQKSYNIQALTNSLQLIANSHDGEIGIAFITDSGDTIAINNSGNYPLMSVFKLHQAIAGCHYLQENSISIDSEVDIPRSKLNSQTWSPMLKDYSADTIRLSIGRLFRYALEQSDNNASNYLFETLADVGYVDSYIARSIPRESFRLNHTEAEMQTNHSLAYKNRTSPLGAAILINKLYTDSTLASPEHLQFIRKSLENCTTGTDRIVAPLQHKSGITIGHKTGSGFRDNGVLAAHNDVAFVRLPDNRHYTLAVFVKDFKGSEQEASRIIAHISQIVYNATVVKR